MENEAVICDLSGDSSYETASKRRLEGRVASSTSYSDSGRRTSFLASSWPIAYQYLFRMCHSCWEKPLTKPDLTNERTSKAQGPLSRMQLMKSNCGVPTQNHGFNIVKVKAGVSGEAFR